MRERLSESDGDQPVFLDRERPEIAGEYGAVIPEFLEKQLSVPSSQFLEFTFLSNSVIFYEKRYLEDAGYGTLYCNFNR